MNAKVYNISILVGLALMAGGMAMISVEVSLIVTGCVIILLTIYGHYMSRGANVPNK